MNDARRSDDAQQKRVLVFKQEDEVEGEPVGPAVVSLDTRGADPADLMKVTVPFVPNCTCEPPVGSPGGRCETCGGEIGEPWVTLGEARAKAHELGLELVRR